MKSLILRPPTKSRIKAKVLKCELEKIFDEELFVQKIRPEVISPEAELEKLSQTPHKEIKSEPHS